MVVVRAFPSSLILFSSYWSTSGWRLGLVQECLFPGVGKGPPVTLFPFFSFFSFLFSFGNLQPPINVQKLQIRCIVPLSMSSSGGGNAAFRVRCFSFPLLPFFHLEARPEERGGKIMSPPYTFLQTSRLSSKAPFPLFPLISVSVCFFFIIFAVSVLSVSFFLLQPYRGLNHPFLFFLFLFPSAVFSIPFKRSLLSAQPSLFSILPWSGWSDEVEPFLFFTTRTYHRLSVFLASRIAVGNERQSRKRADTYLLETG